MSKPGVRSAWIVGLGIVGLAAQLGCSIATAIGTPGPVPDESVSLGMHRSEVEALLPYRQLRESEDEPEVSTVQYDYNDGPRSASKARVALYAFADLFTVGFAEIVLWPIELYASERTARVATAIFDAGDRLVLWVIERRHGYEPLVSIGQRPPLFGPWPVTMAGETAAQHALLVTALEQP